MTVGGTLLVSSDEDDAESQRTKVFPCTLAQRGIKGGSELHCEDFLQKFEFTLIVQHVYVGVGVKKDTLLFTGVFRKRGGSE